MSFSRAAALEYLARSKGLQPLEQKFQPDLYWRLAAAALGAIGVLMIATAVLAAIS